MFYHHCSIATYKCFMVTLYNHKIETNLHFKFGKDHTTIKIQIIRSLNVIDHVVFLTPCPEF
jgi:hypothetical protein